MREARHPPPDCEGQEQAPVQILHLDVPESANDTVFVWPTTAVTTVTENATYLNDSVKTAPNLRVCCFHS